MISDVVEGRKIWRAWNVKAKLKFATRRMTSSVLVKVGISPVDCDGARKNLSAEMPEWDFDGVVSPRPLTCLDRNNSSKIQVKGGSTEQQKVFSTAFYHTAICPNLASDVDGRYRGMDQKIQQDPAYTNYTVFSLWDTFRAQHPLYTIIDPVRDQAWIRALLRKHDEGGILPMWDLASNYTGCMIGYHAVPVIVDAYVKGLRDLRPRQDAMEAVVFASVNTTTRSRFLITPKR
jgi:putative alpha-1,2-mannosidase